MTNLLADETMGAILLQSCLNLNRILGDRRKRSVRSRLLGGFSIQICPKMKTLFFATICEKSLLSRQKE
jgi:hypothetical protein